MKNLIQTVKDNGIFAKEDWLDKDDLNQAKTIVAGISCLKGDPRGIFHNSLKTKIIEHIKFKFDKIKARNFFISLSKKLELKTLADSILDCPSRLINIDCYYAPISEKPVLDWHADNAYSGEKNVKKFVDPENYSIKFFFYLSDVQGNNGCLSYLPESHKIAYALRKGIFEKKIKYTPYWNVKDFINTISIKENSKYISEMIGEKVLERFLSIANNANLTTGKFDKPIKAGGAVVFNEGGIHKGNKTSVSPRYALRFFFKKDKDFN